jgi:hypothetical protein
MMLTSLDSPSVEFVGVLMVSRFMGCPLAKWSGKEGQSKTDG